MPKIILSPSKLHVYLQCPRCFWLQEARGIHRPTTIFPSLPGGMDAVLKKYFDTWRARGTLPQEIAGKIEGRLIEDDALLKKWRNNRVGLRWRDDALEAELMGALDDCLFDGSHYIPVDFKTRGWEVKENSHALYQNQLDTYTLLLEKNGFAHRSHAYLIFYSPREVREGGIVHFTVNPVKLKTYPKNAEAVFRAAVALIRGPMPTSPSACAFCSWAGPDSAL